MRIKLLLGILAIVAMVCAPAQAQNEVAEPRHEIGVSYGAVPNSIWIDALTDIIPAMFGHKYENTSYVGPIGLEYYYHTSKLVGVGAIAVLATNSEDVYYKEEYCCHRNKSYYTLMPAIKFNWLRKAKWGMYSKVGIGATLSHFKDGDNNDNETPQGEVGSTNDVIFNFQASLLGVEVGGQQVRGFAELGIGEQGIILAGVRYKF
ncbi:MAG: hypothetical protein IKZ92_02640 [Muribaculaceae bacterium]|nr:hypothetical protein [Muribaculaceae bacterium]